MRQGNWQETVANWKHLTQKIGANLLNNERTYLKVRARSETRKQSDWNN